MELLFERFLSEERGEWPDIDLDLPSGDQRERAIQYVYERYGKRGAAMTANVITYRGRSAAREIGKALGFDAETLGAAGEPGQCSGNTKIPPTRWNESFSRCGIRPEASEDSQIFRVVHSGAGFAAASGAALRRHGGVPGAARFGRSAGAGDHAGRVVVQWDKEDCADLGIVKIDLLGLGHDGGAGRFAPNHSAIITAKKSIWHICRRTMRKFTKLCRRPTPSGCFRLKAGRRCRACRG